MPEVHEGSEQPYAEKNQANDRKQPRSALFFQSAMAGYADDVDRVSPGSQVRSML